MTEIAAQPVFVSAKDGTRLFAADSGTTRPDALPLLCLPGLTRSSRDFEPVFTRFAGERRIIAMDFRGRGRSASALDPQSYRPDVELDDVIALLDHLSLPKVAVLGTSRGGIVGMLMAAAHPARIAGLCLNDVGLVLEQDGLLRIRGYLGIDTRHVSWAAAAGALARSSIGFEGVTEEQWEASARRIFLETADGIVPHYDVRLAETFPSAETISSGTIPDLWGLAPALAKLPTAILRGSGSDLLSRATVAEMSRRIPHLATTEIAGRGHVPFLDEADAQAAITQWLAVTDASR